MWQELRGWRRGLPVSGSRAMIGQAIRHLQVVTVEVLLLTVCAMIVLLLARILSK